MGGGVVGVDNSWHVVGHYSIGGGGELESRAINCQKDLGFEVVLSNEKPSSKDPD